MILVTDVNSGGESVYTYLLESTKLIRIGKIRSIAIICLTSQFRSHMHRFIVKHVFAFANMPLCCGLIKLSATMWTLNVITGITGWRWWQVGGVYSFRYRCLILLGRTNRIDEILVFAPPIRFHLRFFRCLKQHGNISAFIFWLRLLSRQIRLTNYLDIDCLTFSNINI